jgi:hypothetical protein
MPHCSPLGGYETQHGTVPATEHAVDRHSPPSLQEDGTHGHKVVAREVSASWVFELTTSDVLLNNVQNAQEPVAAMYATLKEGATNVFEQSKKRHQKVRFLMQAAPVQLPDTLF